MSNDEALRPSDGLTLSQITVHPAQEAYRIKESGEREVGRLFFVEQVRSLGALRLSYEYNLYYWPDSDSWSGDVISPHGWHDIEDADLERLLKTCALDNASRR